MAGHHDKLPRLRERERERKIQNYTQREREREIDRESERESERERERERERAGKIALLAATGRLTLIQLKRKISHAIWSISITDCACYG